jgi:hypothetical protein
MDAEKEEGEVRLASSFIFERDNKPLLAYTW